ncbi:ABC transporter substrate-binding protein [Methylobacterium terricola]|nr:ABC transporter substrate-binding protein [Methylobacterium terricola]
MAAVGQGQGMGRAVATGPCRRRRAARGRAGSATLGGPANDSALTLLPAFARRAGRAPATVTVGNMQPALREPMLQRGQVDGVSGFVTTIRFSARLVGIDPDRDLRFIDDAKSGLDLDSDAVIASRRLVAQKSEAAPGLLRAIDRGLTEMLKDPDAAIEAVARREPLTDRDIEKARRVAPLKAAMSHPEGRRIGPTRVPAVGEVFSRAFLPPRPARMLPVPKN